MPLQQTSGNVTTDAYGGGVAVAPVYIEDVMSTFLYTGNGSTQTITNGIDLAGKGGLVWIKRRVNTPNASNVLTDTARGVQKELYSNSTSAQATNIYGLNSFNADGFGIGNASSYDYAYNEPNKTYVSWTFRKQPKFFDIVTYTGNGALPNQLISHNLGSVPGCIIIKATNASGNWIVWHRGDGTTNYTGFSLNLTSASVASVASGDLPTATQFKPAAFFDPDYNGANTTGVTYVAYLFAHNAGGFGLTGTDNVISCGSFTSDASGNFTPVNLGYEPQWLLVKNTNGAGNWILMDNMRGFSANPITFSSTTAELYPNTSGAETSGVIFNPTATGFDGSAPYNSQTYIYIAIRRGPMKVPTSGTSVFTPAIGTTDYTGPQFDATFPRVDGIFEFFTTGGGVSLVDRLRGDTQRLKTYSTAAEVSSEIPLDMMYGAGDGGSVYDRAWMFGRAPSFFDEVCYTGTGSATTFNHNLGVAPELMIVKIRSSTANWTVYAQPLGATQRLFLNGTNPAIADSGPWNDTAPTSSVFTVGVQTTTNGASQTYVNYLFASCPGVSKVTNFTGNGSTQTINCGFTTGARFVLIKATSTTGNWLVFDTARGMTTSTDPWLALNSTAAESATTGACTTTSVGFTVDESKLTGVNTNGVSYIVLAIA